MAVLQSQLGPPAGELLLREDNRAVSGGFSLLSRRSSFSGSLLESGKYLVSGTLRSSVDREPYDAVFKKSRVPAAWKRDGGAEVTFEYGCAGTAVGGRISGITRVKDEVTPRHNGKVERSHRKDNEYIYASHKVFSFQDFQKQLAVRQRQYNAFPICPLSWRPPSQALSDFVTHY